MTRASLLLAVITAAAFVGASCRPRSSAEQLAGPSAPPGSVTAPAPGPVAAPAGSLSPEAEDGRLIVEGEHRYPVRTWSFDLSRYEVSIEDAGMSPDLGRVLARTGGELAVNGGFFDPAGKPLGLAVSGGAVLARQAREMSGGIVAIEGDRARLLEGETASLPAAPRFAIQCRPRLVVGGAPNVRSDDGHRAERAALCLRREGQQIDVVVVRSEPGGSLGPSLFALGQFLARRGCEGALNLDGGPSTGVAWREEGKPQILAPRGPVRHAVVFKKRG